MVDAAIAQAQSDAALGRAAQAFARAAEPAPDPARLLEALLADASLGPRAFSYHQVVGPSPESEIARLQRQLRELQEEAAATEVVAKQEATGLHAGVQGDPWRGWTAISVAVGLLVAAALALPAASLFTTPMGDPNCHVPLPRGEAMRKFNQAFPGLHGSQP